MPNTCNILLTFDYELFQGKRSGTVENCVLKPTASILKILSERKAKAIFFIDMMYLMRMSEAAQVHSKAEKDFELIKEQMMEMANKGHYVFNHLHPHWLDAVYNAENNQWELMDASKYSFELLSPSEQTYVFEKTMQLLNDILQKATYYMPTDGFRAGGLYIQPFSVFKPYFDKHHIKYEFSVLLGAKGELQDGRSRFDFTKIPKSIYRFTDAVEVEDMKGLYTEYALEYAEITPFPRILNSIFHRVSSRFNSFKRYGDGLPSSNKMQGPMCGKYTSMETYSLELLNDIKLPFYLNKAATTQYLHLLSHPKLVSPGNLKAFDRLLKKLQSRGPVEYDFKAFKWQS